MRLSQLRNVRIRTVDGAPLGRVHEVLSDGGRIVALVCGPGSFIASLTAKAKGRRIPWESVKRICDKEVIVAQEPPKRKPVRKPAASRSRQGTRRPSARRSKR